MNLEFVNKKWMWTSEEWTSTWWFRFDYSKVSDINSLPELFTINIWWETYNATINNTAINPIVVETDNGTHRFKAGEATENLDFVNESMIKLNIYIWDAISWLIRVEQITLGNWNNSV